MYKQINTICKPQRLFALTINCAIIMKTKSRFSRNVYAISDREWCNKHLMHTTMEKYDNNGKASDLMMIITWAIDISFQSPKMKWLVYWRIYASLGIKEFKYTYIYSVWFYVAVPSPYLTRSYLGCGNNSASVSFKLSYEMIRWALHMKLILGECHSNPLMISRRWFR